MTIKEAIADYTGKKRITTKEIKQVGWVVRHRNLTLAEAVKYYYTEKENDKETTLSEYLSRKSCIKKEILERCANCPRHKDCITNMFIEENQNYTLDDLKDILMSDCNNGSFHMFSI